MELVDVNLLVEGIDLSFSVSWFLEITAMLHCVFTSCLYPLEHVIYSNFNISKQIHNTIRPPRPHRTMMPMFGDLGDVTFSGIVVSRGSVATFEKLSPVVLVGGVIVVVTSQPHDGRGGNGAGFKLKPLSDSLVKLK